MSDVSGLADCGADDPHPKKGCTATNHQDLELCDMAGNVFEWTTTLDLKTLRLVSDLNVDRIVGTTYHSE